jgi:hypothetical protein
MNYELFDNSDSVFIIDFRKNGFYTEGSFHVEISINSKIKYPN